MNDIFYSSCFALGLVFGFLFGSGVIENTDIAAEKIYAMLSLGEPLCEAHGGMKAWDIDGNITCGNGFVIDTSTGK